MSEAQATVSTNTADFSPPPRPRMRVVSERPMAPPQPPAPVAAPAPPGPAPNDRAWRAALIASMQAIVLVVAARAVLFLAAVGAFVLAWVALRDPQPLRLGAAGMFDLLVFLPAVWLAAKKG